MEHRPAEKFRHCPRVCFQSVVILRSAVRQIPCKSLNLSESGILVRPLVSQSPGLQFRVTFTLGKGARCLDLEGRIVRQSWGGPPDSPWVLWGIEFIGVPAALRGVLRRLVTTRETRSSPSALERVPTRYGLGEFGGTEPAVREANEPWNDVPTTEFHRDRPPLLPQGPGVTAPRAYDENQVWKTSNEQASGEDGPEDHDDTAPLVCTWHPWDDSS